MYHPRQCVYMWTLAPALISRAHTLLRATPGWTGQPEGDHRGRASAAGSVPPPGPATAQEETSMGRVELWTQRRRLSAHQGTRPAAVISIIN